MLPIIMGMKKGLTFFGPKSIMSLCDSSIVSRPPRPQPITTPARERYLRCDLEVGVFHAIVGGAQGKGEERIHFSEFFLCDELLGMIFFDLPGNVCRICGAIKAGDRPDS